MSQAKVDKYKEEKKNRAKIMKRNKIKKAIIVVVSALGLGAIIGIPLGKFIYTKKKEEEAKHRTIATAEYDNWFEKKWAGEYAEMFGSNPLDDLGSVTDASESDASESDASESDAEVIDLDSEDGEEINLDDVELEEE